MILYRHGTIPKKPHPPAGSSLRAGFRLSDYKSRSNRRYHRLACFWRSVSESAIMAMNSLFVGLPLMFETV